MKHCLEKIKEIKRSGKFDIFPLSIEFPAETKTPIEVFKILLNISENSFILEGISEGCQKRYTYIGISPKLKISCRDNEMRIGDFIFKTNNPGSHIRMLLSKYKSPSVDGLPPFTGGLAGYFSYDYIKYAEPSLNLSAENPDKLEDIELMLFDKIAVFDNLENKIVLIKNIPLQELETEYANVQIELEQIANFIRSTIPKENLPGKLTTGFSQTLSESDFSSIVNNAKYHISEGDIFQLVLSNCFMANYEGNLLNVYCNLRESNPSPYMFYFSGFDAEIAGASPETLVKLQNDTVFTFPLAGTRPRGKTDEEDKAFEKELLNDPKELAEHDMLVDLGRNDIGKISNFGTVKVEKYHSIERFSHVMHIGSTVSGNIKDGKDAIDAINAVLPAGTLSGAPKIRACQIIDDLEKNKRGIYGGAIGYIGFQGNVDMCIAIRTAFKKNGKIFVRSGAGIVADSSPEKEYIECLNKAAAVIDAINATKEVE